MAHGKSKAALDHAKEHHKKQNTAASEALLVDVYRARIQALLEQNLSREAKALIDLVQERYPAARARLEGIGTAVAARAGSLDDWIRPLNDPQVSPEQREAIEQVVRKEVCDLAALAACPVLPPEHPLRQAASALDRAFTMVTSGPVTEDAIRLPEISRRSPLAPWKLLVRAIAACYRGDGGACREQLDAIPGESAPARLIPAMRAMLGIKSPIALTAAATALVQQVSGDPAALRRALESLDRALAADQERAVVAAVRTVVQECRQTAPEQLTRLRQHITVRCAVANLDKDEIIRAMGGPPREDAYFYRLFARAMEQSGELENIAISCAAWDQFRQAAVREGWFPANGVEAATLYLHMAEQARQLPVEILRDLKHGKMKLSREERYFISPEELYQRACALDPHTEAFSQWMDWARQNSASQAERVAAAWHKICPGDLEPILHLMKQAANRKAFPSALQYLGRAEQIDGVHPEVRQARLRLTAGAILRHLQQKKPPLAAEKLATLAALPQTQQGDRPAFLAALRFLVSAVGGDTQRAEAAHAEVERLLGHRMAAQLLIFGAAVASKQRALEKLEEPGSLSTADRAAIPTSLARVTALFQDLNCGDCQISWPYIEEAAKQLRGSSSSLDAGQLQVLAEAGLNAKHFDLAYTASAAGLERGGATEARFLLLRARALPQLQFERRALCTAAAAHMARQHRDMDLLEQAVALLRGPLESADLVLTAEEAEEVLRKEKAEPASLGRNAPGPDYGAMLRKKLCDCPDCRRERGESVEPFEDMDLDEILASTPLPPDMPKEIAQILLEETKRAVERGESLDSLMARLFGPEARSGSKKRRRK